MTDGIQYGGSGGPFGGDGNQIGGERWEASQVSDSVDGEGNSGLGRALLLGAIAATVALTGPPTAQAAGAVGPSGPDTNLQVDSNDMRLSDGTVVNDVYAAVAGNKIVELDQNPNGSFTARGYYQPGDATGHETVPASEVQAAVSYARGGGGDGSGRGWLDDQGTGDNVAVTDGSIGGA